MSFYFKNLQPGYDSDSGSGDDLEEALSKTMKRRLEEQNENDESSDDELKTLSFGSLKKADKLLEEEDEKVKNVPLKRSRKVQNVERKSEGDEERQNGRTFREETFEDDSEDNSSDEGFFEEESNNNRNKSRRRNDSNDKKSKHKHAPKEHSSKKRVSKIRDIPGLNVPQTMNTNLYNDIRFDKSTGEATDVNVIRRRYAFLDEYREKEIHELERMLHDRKFLAKVTDDDREEMQERLTSMKSRLQSVKNRDLEQNIIKEYEDEINKDNTTRYHLKKSEKRKVVQKWKFDHMKAKQREKVMERKRKKRLGKEFKQFEFHNR